MGMYDYTENQIEGTIKGAFEDYKSDLKKIYPEKVK